MNNERLLVPIQAQVPTTSLDECSGLKWSECLMDLHQTQVTPPNTGLFLVRVTFLRGSFSSFEPNVTQPDSN